MNGLFRVLALAVSDILCLVGVWAFSLWGYSAVGLGHYKFGLEFYLRLWPVPLAFVAINALFRLYHGNPLSPAAPVNPAEELRRLFGSSFITHVGTLAALALMFQTTLNYSRAVIVLSGALTAFLAQPLRDLVRFALKRAGLGQIPVEVIGSERAREAVIADLRDDFHTGFVPVEDAGRASIAIICPDGNGMRSDVSEIVTRYAHVELLPPDATFPLYVSRTVSCGGFGALEVVNQRRMPLLRAEKRILDYVMSALVFVLVSPLFIVIPLAIRMTSRGPAFYRHRRMGRNGRPLDVWKFRSMYADADRRLRKVLAEDPQRKAEWEATFKLKDDPRITPIGRLLRRTSFDELPQLFNVLAGEMTLVGPRPIVSAEVPRYGGDYPTISSVRPGVTGLWQVSGRSDTDYPVRIKLDLQYVLNWSPWMDLWILMRTVVSVLLMRGAR